jgi:predicted hydrolase (HD superfamily)
MIVDDARALMHLWTESEALRVHMECVAACMGGYAEKLHPGDGRLKERWIIAGLLHDYDYEKHPSLAEHPRIGVQNLRESTDVDDEILSAIMGHNPATGVPRTSELAKVLFAVDELAGFIVACAKVRPNGISDMEAKSVKKKLKDKAFAAAVSRSDIALGIEELGAEQTGHIQTCIDAIRAEAQRLGV